MKKNSFYQISCCLDKKRWKSRKIREVSPLAQLGIKKDHSESLLQDLVEREAKVASPEESDRIVTHENVPFSSNGNYERRSSKLTDENAKCPSCI